MKKILSLVLCLVLAFSAVSLTASARITYVLDCEVTITKVGSKIVGHGAATCDSASVDLCTITVSIQSRDAYSSDSWDNEVVFLGHGDYSCSATNSTPIVSGKEYRTKLMITAYPTDQSADIDYTYAYTEIYRP